MMVKVFNLSLHRSGTQSFRAFMEWHGRRTTHWPGWDFEALAAAAVARLATADVWAGLDAVLTQFEAFCDLPFSLLYQEAFSAYPDAKFLIILRDVSEWIASVRRHAGARLLTPYEKLQYWSNCDKRPESLAEYTDEDLEAVYLAHLAKVTSFMSEQRGCFRAFWLNDRDLGYQCADYLDFEKVHDFPSIDYTRPTFASG